MVAVAELEVHGATPEIGLTVDNDVVGMAVALSDPLEEQLGGFLGLLVDVPVVPEKAPPTLFLDGSLELLNDKLEWLEIFDLSTHELLRCG